VVIPYSMSELGSAADQWRGVVAGGSKYARDCRRFVSLVHRHSVLGSHRPTQYGYPGFHVLGCSQMLPFWRQNIVVPPYAAHMRGTKLCWVRQYRMPMHPNSSFYIDPKPMHDPLIGTGRCFTPRRS